MLLRPERLGACWGVLAILGAMTGAVARADDPLYPLPPVSATPIQTSDPLLAPAAPSPVQSLPPVEPLPSVESLPSVEPFPSSPSVEPLPVPPPSIGAPWIKDDAPGVTGYEPSCKPGCLYCPWIYAGAEYLFLTRSGQGAVPLIADVNTGETLVNSNQLGFGSLSGARAWFGIRCGKSAALEFGFLNYFDAKASRLVNDYDFPDATLGLPGDLGGASNVFFGTNRFQIDYASQFNSYEINFASCCTRGCPTNCSPKQSWIGSIEWLAGFRYLTLNEQLNIYGERDEFGGVETGNYNVRTTNDLYGGQLGVRLRHCWGRFSGEAVAKGGLFANYATQNQYVLDYPDFYLLEPTSAKHTSLAFAGELGLTGIYQINQHWGLRAGYNLIYLDGLALAPQQLDYTYTLDSGKTLRHNGDLFLHGISVGIEARW